MFPVGTLTGKLNNHSSAFPLDENSSFPFKNTLSPCVVHGADPTHCSRDWSSCLSSLSYWFMYGLSARSISSLAIFSSTTGKEAVFSEIMVNWDYLGAVFVFMWRVFIKMKPIYMVLFTFTNYGCVLATGRKRMTIFGGCVVLIYDQSI